MSVQLRSESCTVEITTQGAELLSFKVNETDTEYVWQGEPNVWKRRAPFLFPIVGKLKEDQYIFDGETYELSQHGFLRDSLFEVVEQSDVHALLHFKSNEATKAVYPFDFSVWIRYQLNGKELSVRFSVENLGRQTMYFSYGNHPGFNVPLDDSLTFEDYVVRIEPEKMRKQILLTEERQADIDNPVQSEESTIVLDHERFKQDALIFETDEETAVTISSPKDKKKITLTFKDYPYVGIWSAYPAKGNLVCIEPWCGLADRVGTNQKLKEKTAIETVEPGKIFEREFFLAVE